MRSIKISYSKILYRWNDEDAKMMWSIKLNEQRIIDKVLRIKGKNDLKRTRKTKVNN